MLNWNNGWDLHQLHLEIFHFWWNIYSISVKDVNGETKSTLAHRLKCKHDPKREGNNFAIRNKKDFILEALLFDRVENMELFTTTKGPPKQPKQRLFCVTIKYFCVYWDYIFVVQYSILFIAGQHPIECQCRERNIENPTMILLPTIKS